MDSADMVCTSHMCFAANTKIDIWRGNRSLKILWGETWSVKTIPWEDFYPPFCVVSAPGDCHHRLAANWPCISIVYQELSESRPLKFTSDNLGWISIMQN